MMERPGDGEAELPPPPTSELLCQEGFQGIRIGGTAEEEGLKEKEEPGEEETKAQDDLGPEGLTLQTLPVEVRY
jgi:hypothetical protein